MTPFLSICVPSRNRQIYFQKTIEALLKSPHQNVEFVFTDNSDDPSIMNDFMADIVARDPRVVYIPSGDTTFAMVDNWERTMAASTGDWIVFIGDDDYVDPDLVELLPNVIAVDPTLDAFTWSVTAFIWPWEERLPGGSFISLESFVVKIPQAEVVNRMFGWKQSSHVPLSGFSIYHSAIARPLMEKIKRKYGNRYFEHPIVDYDNAFKVICSGTSFAMTSRPFSVAGSCPASNSFSLSKIEMYKERILTFIDEVGRDFEDDKNTKGFPFKALLGTPATIMQAQQWFKTKYNLKYPNWEEDFAKACEHDVRMCLDRDDFDMRRKGYEAAFRAWDNGKHLKHFKPEYAGAPVDAKHFITSGFKENGVYLDQNIAGVTNPGELFDIVRAIVAPASQIPVDVTGLKRPSQYFAERERLKKSA